MTRAIRNRRIYVGLGLGLFVAGLTAGIQMLEGMHSNPIMEVLGPVLMPLMMPGLIGSMGISNNVHAFSLAAAAIINFIIYFGIGWLVCAFFTRDKKTKGREAGRPLT